MRCSRREFSASPSDAALRRFCAARELKRKTVFDIPCGCDGHGFLLFCCSECCPNEVDASAAARMHRATCGRLNYAFAYLFKPFASAIRLSICSLLSSLAIVYSSRAFDGSGESMSKSSVGVIPRYSHI